MCCIQRAKSLRLLRLQTNPYKVNSLSNCFIPVAPSASAAYGNMPACEACFTLHQTEAALVRAERRLAAAVGGTCSSQATRRENFGRTGADSGAGLATRRRAESRGVGVEGRGSWAGDPRGGVGWSSDCGGGGRRGLRGSRSAGGLDDVGRRQSATFFFGKREVSTRLSTLPYRRLSIIGRG